MNLKTEIEWFDFKDELFRPKKNERYLLYGHKMYGDEPGIDVALWNGSLFISPDDGDYWFKSSQIDFYAELGKISPPKKQR